MDMVVKAGHIPVPGETVLGGKFFMNPGGKGANQAVAVSRLGGNVVFLSKVGTDIFGRQSIQHLEQEGIDTTSLVTDDSCATGVALITVDDHGENSIVVAPGANAELRPEDLTKTFSGIADASFMLIQLEIPMDTVRNAAEIGAKRGIKVILNPAPANDKISEIFPFVDIITPNSTEAEMLTGIQVSDIESAKRAAVAIHEKGIENVVITIGPKGALVSENGVSTHVPALVVDTIDTTAAGDAFNGALAVYLSEGKSLVEAVKFACSVAAITVTRLGAQAAMPFRKEVSTYLSN
ncbi:UNVERIFIED_CONTAM: hypothetical protein GTU68_007680 [Idotea baltica]|nr:hypothetical protein [Idotea baltica]